MQQELAAGGQGVTPLGHLRRMSHERGMVQRCGPELRGLRIAIGHQVQRSHAGVPSHHCIDCRQAVLMRAHDDHFATGCDLLRQAANDARVYQHDLQLRICCAQLGARLACQVDLLQHGIAQGGQQADRQHVSGMQNAVLQNLCHRT